MNKINKLITLLMTLFAVLLLFPKLSHASCSYVNEAYKIDSTGENATPIYRLYNTRTGVHLYARGTSDANRVLGKWTEFEYTDGVPAFCMSLGQKTGLTPIYRLYNTRTGVHVYVRGETEKTRILNRFSDFEFSDSGPAFWASTSQKSGLVPIYRLYNTRTGVHVYARGEESRNNILNRFPDFEFTDGTPAFWADVTNDAGLELIDIDYLGPEITVGLWSFTRDELENDAFEIDANKDYVIKNDDKKIIGTIDKDTRTKVKYNGSGELRVYDSINETISDEVVYFEAADGNNSDMIFDTHLPDYSYDEYRGKIKLRYSNDSRNIWVINTLPLEHYVWGDGELAGTGDADHNRVMVTSYRTYGYWWIQYATKWASEGFKVNATPGNQLYKGYEYEEAHPRVREAAEDTRGQIVMHDGETAITPYSSWTDGETRCFPKVWGDHDSGCSDTYSWCKSVDDPYGDYNGDSWDNGSSLSTSSLMAGGNHMVGLSAHGSVTLANDKGWSWTKILNYYFDDIDITSIY
ncbi:MAG: hypothetical protein PF549_02355 [Patescibacteria group bacterium]|jgi:hypothetical protein|nr:hypothetical protein [Patescibacteria group bacterium]